MRKLMGLTPSGQRAYLDSHRVVEWLSMGIALTGYLNLFFPSLVAESSASAIFSSTVLLLFNLCWASGGTLAVFGLLRGKPKVEGAGMSLLAAGMGANYIAFASLKFPDAAAQGIFVLFLAIGCAKRARHLATHSYVVLDVPHDQPGLHG